MNQAFDFEDLVELCRRTHEETRHSAARAVDTYSVTRNWLFGWYIVEYEQHGADRAEYGRGLIASLSGKLKAGEVRGCSPTNLRKFREFYLAYAEIQQAVSVEFTEPTQNQQAISGDREISETSSRILTAPPSGLLPVSGSGLCDLSRERLADYLTAIVGDREVPETDEAWHERLCALGFMTEREDGPPSCTIEGDGTGIGTPQNARAGYNWR